MAAGPLGGLRRLTPLDRAVFVLLRVAQQLGSIREGMTAEVKNGSPSSSYSPSGPNGRWHAPVACMSPTSLPFRAVAPDAAMSRDGPFLGRAAPRGSGTTQTNPATDRSKARRAVPRGDRKAPSATSLPAL